MMGMLILCAILWLMLGEAVRWLALAGSVANPRYAPLVANTPKWAFWVAGPFVMLALILGD